MTIEELGNNLISLGELLKRPDWKLNDLAAAARKCGMRVGITLDEIEPLRDPDEVEKEFLERFDEACDHVWSICRSDGAQFCECGAQRND